MKILKIVFLLLTSILLLAGCSGFKKTWSANDFKLSVDVPKYKISVGEKITFTAELKNISGKDVIIGDNGTNPKMYFKNVNDKTPFGDTMQLVVRPLKTNEPFTNTYEFTPTEAGTYLLQVKADFFIGKQGIVLTYGMSTLEERQKGSAEIDKFLTEKQNILIKLDDIFIEVE